MLVSRTKNMYFAKSNLCGHCLAIWFVEYTLFANIHSQLTVRFYSGVVDKSAVFIHICIGQRQDITLATSSCHTSSWTAYFHPTLHCLLGGCLVPTLGDTANTTPSNLRITFDALLMEGFRAECNWFGVRQWIDWLPCCSDSGAVASSSLSSSSLICLQLFGAFLPPFVLVVCLVAEAVDVAGCIFKWWYCW